MTPSALDQSVPIDTTGKQGLSNSNFHAFLWLYDVRLPASNMTSARIDRIVQTPAVTSLLARLLWGQAVVTREAPSPMMAD